MDNLDSDILWEQKLFIEKNKKKIDNNLKKVFIDSEKLLEDNDRHITKILGEIYEKEFSEPPIKVNTTFGFPKSFKADSHESGEKKVSIFASLMKKKSPTDVGVDKILDLESKQERPPPNSVQEPKSFKRSTILDLLAGSLDKHDIDRIHEENSYRLSQLDEAQIIQEREEILKSVDPKILSFLIDRKNREDVKKECQTARDAKPVEDIEADKLKWMTDLPYLDDERQNSLSESKIPARFDFQGFVVPLGSKISVKDGLNHHGEEPERPGYTISELFHLSRSAVPNQKLLALTTLVACLERSRRGHHIPSLHPIENPSLIYSLVQVTETNPSACGIFFLLRWTMDESIRDITTISSGLTGISMSILNVCLDGFIWLFSDPSEETLFDCVYDNFKLKCTRSMPCCTETHQKKDDSEEEENDNKAMQTDPLLCLVHKTSIILRINWFLAFIINCLNNVGNVGQDYQLSAIQMLNKLSSLMISFTRHSSYVTYKIFKEETLLSNLISVRIDGKRLLLGSTMKLFRSILQTNSSIGNCLITSVNMFALLSEFFSPEPSSYFFMPNETELRIEMLKLYRSILECFSEETEHSMDHSKGLHEFHAKHLRWVLPLDLLKGDDPLLIATHLSVIKTLIKYSNNLKLERMANSHLKEIIKLTTIYSEKSLHSFLHLVSPDMESVNTILKEKPAYLVGECLQMLIYGNVHDLMDKDASMDPVCAYSKVLSDKRRLYDNSFFEWILKRYLNNQSSQFGRLEDFFDISVNLCEEMPFEYLRAVHCEQSKSEPFTGQEPDWQDMPVSQRIDEALIEEVFLSSEKIASLRITKDFRHEYPKASRLMSYTWPPKHSKQLHRNLFPIFASFAILVTQVIDLGCVASPLHDITCRLLCEKMSRLNDGTFSRQCQRRGLLNGIENEILSALLLCLYKRNLVSLEKYNTFNFRFVFTLTRNEEENCRQLLSLIFNETNQPREVVDAYQKVLTRKTKGLHSISESNCPRVECAEALLFENVLTSDWPYLPILTGEKVNSELYLPTFKFISSIYPFNVSEKATFNACDHILRLMLAISRADICIGFNEIGAELEGLLKKILLHRPSLQNEQSITEACLPPTLAPSFYDIFSSFCDYYSSTSYGSSVLANLLLWPCRNSFHVKYRRCIWNEKRSVLLALRLHPKEILYNTDDFLGLMPQSQLTDTEYFDESLIKTFLSALASKSIDRTRNPFAYLWALHHVNSFVYAKRNRESQVLKMAANLFHMGGKFRNDALLNDLKYYKGPSKEDNLFDVYDNLPESRQKHFKQLFDI